MMKELTTWLPGLLIAFILSMGALGLGLILGGTVQALLQP